LGDRGVDVVGEQRERHAGKLLAEACPVGLRLAFSKTITVGLSGAGATRTIRMRRTGRCRTTV